MSLVQFQPNPLLEQLLNGEKLGCLTTSPLLPNQLRLDVASLAFRPGATISCSVAATESQVLSVATLDCLEVKVEMGEVEVVVEKELVVEGSRLLLTFKAVAKGCYKVSVRLSSQDVLGSPLNLPVLENPVAVLAKLGLVLLPDSGYNSTGAESKVKQNEVSNKSASIGALPKPEDLADNCPQVENTSKLAKAQSSSKFLSSQTYKSEVFEVDKSGFRRQVPVEDSDDNLQQMVNTSKPSKPHSSSKPLSSQTSKLNVSKSLASQARGEHCFVQHEGEWHAGVLHAVIHETLVTVRNLTLDQYRGVHPSQLVFEEVDLPEGRKLAPSALDLLKKKAEEKPTEAKGGGPKDLVDDGRNGTKGELVQGGLKVTLGRGTERTVAVEQRQLKEIKTEPVKKEKVEESLEEVKATESEKKRKDEKQWKEGEKCLARWDEDEVGHCTMSFFSSLATHKMSSVHFLYFC